MAFQKKPEFGGATISAQNVNHDGKGIYRMIEKGSSFILNGIKSNGELKDVESLLYGKIYGKKSG